MSHANRTTLVISAILLLPAAAAAQQGAAEVPDSPLAPGDRVRLEARRFGAGRHEAHLLALRGDTLVLSGAFRPGGRAETVRVPLPEVVSLEVTRGTKSNAWTGAKIGAGIGAALGLMAGIAVMSSSEFPFKDAGAEAIPAGMLQVGLLGGLLGLGIGALSRSDEWESVPPARLRVEPRDGGAAVVASLPLRL